MRVFWFFDAFGNSGHTKDFLNVKYYIKKIIILNNSTSKINNRSNNVRYYVRKIIIK